MSSAREPKKSGPARLGRPIKEARKGRRYQIGVMVTGARKQLIAKRAKESGRSISGEVEMIIERAIQDEQWFAATRLSRAELERAIPEGWLREHGYTPATVGWESETGAKQTGSIWFPPGYPVERIFRFREPPK